MQFTLKSNVFHLDKIEDEVYYLSDSFGKQYGFTYNEVNENFYPIEKFENTKKTKTSRKTTLEQYANAYLEMGELVKQSNENNEDYIFEVKNNNL